jgi:anaerobic selenocysteine-containing dehydrogenase
VEVVLQVARNLGGSVAVNLPWPSFEALLREGARGLYEVQRGYVVSTGTEEALRKILERQGYWVPEFESYDDFWTALRARGAWWDASELPLSRKALLKTRSGKFEFYSSRLKRLIEEAVQREGSASPFLGLLGGRSGGDLPYLPVVEIPPAAEPGAFPLRLNTYRLVTRPTGGGQNQPWLLEQPAVHVRASWESWVEISPDTAADLGIGSDDWVWVESAKGRIRLKAKLYDGTRPEVVQIPLFAGEGPNPNEVIAHETDAFRGFGLLNTTRVKVYKG